MSDLARAIQAANQRTAEMEVEYAQLRERKEHLEGQLAKCIGWLGEAEMRVAAEIERSTLLRSALRELRNGPDTLTPTGLEIVNRALVRSNA